MKKLLIATALAFTAFAPLAADKVSYSNAIDGYSPDGKFFYAGLPSEGSRGLFSSYKAGNTTRNIQIFDLANNTSRKLFPKDMSGGVTVLNILFPPHQKSDSGGRYFRNVKPNADGPKKALVVLFLPGRVDKSYQELWSMRQDGSQLKKITRIKSGGRWHVDVANKKIRVFTLIDKNVEQQIFDW